MVYEADESTICPICAGQIFAGDQVVNTDEGVVHEACELDERVEDDDPLDE